MRDIKISDMRISTLIVILGCIGVVFMAPALAQGVILIGVPVVIWRHLRATGR